MDALYFVQFVSKNDGNLEVLLYWWSVKCAALKIIVWHDWKKKKKLVHTEK